ncbi:hypothetical protein V6N12_050478 [Hibiscus sabdariffa]|uniref:Uncharacterized protein n=1 Tax=Hibiscus sabdariffa TaxID=183260 RepID=A0ABR2GCU0_9ROSI
MVFGFLPRIFQAVPSSHSWSLIVSKSSSSRTSKLVYTGAVIGQVHSIACVEFQHPVEIGAGWLPSKAEPAKIVEPFVDDWLQAVVGLGIFEEKSMFVPSAFGSNLLVINACRGSEEMADAFSDADLTASCSGRENLPLVLQWFTAVKYLPF